MKGMKSLIGWLVCLFAAALLMAPPSPAAEAPAMTVGRIFHIEGDLLRYVPEEKDWVAVVPDAPFGAEDTLFSGSNGRAELIIPNGIWIRTGNSTQIQFITLEADLAEMDLASGTARFSNKGQAVVKVTSDFGYILADPGTIFDAYVGENAVEVISVKGTVSFVHSATNERYEVAAGAASILADPQQVSLGDGTVDPDWNRWNMDRENFWLAKETLKGPSAEYLPPDLRNDAYTLEENGRWERVPYEGQERWFWQPTAVAADWSPFTVGRWTDWYGDETWIPAEPFGYVTHHYGNWIYARNRWYWAPPVVGVRIGLPLLDVGFFWCPGRVAWIHSGVNVGWVPLAPRETYYSRRPWGGPRTVVINNVNINRVSIDIRSHAYVDHAIIVNRSNFVGRDNYRNVRVANINHTTIINQYQAAPVVSNKVIKDYSTTRQRYNFTNTPLLEKPHNVVINRIEQNQKIVREGRKEKASAIEERLKGVPEGKINREARVEQPRGADHIVPAKEVNRPKAEMKLPQKEIKGGSRVAAAGGPGQAPGPAERSTPTMPAQPERTAPRTERTAAPARTGQPAQSVQPAQPARPADRFTPGRPAPPEPAAPRTERAAPVRPAQPVQPAQPTTERVIPVQPGQQAQPARPVERVMPARPAQPEPAAPRTERAAPARPAQPVQPAQPTTERVIPVQPGQQAQPARPVERVIPARPAQPEPAAPRTERVAPAQPAQPAQPARPAERVVPARPAQPEPIAPRTERAAPVQPSQQAQPARPVERVIPARPVQPEPAAPRTERAAPAQPAQPARPVERVVPVPAKPQPAAQPERAAPAKPAPSEQVKPENTPSQPEPKENKPGRREPPGR